MLIFTLAAIGLFANGCQPKTITILHTNDIHAAFLPHEAAWVRSEVKPQVGGFVELGFLVDSLRLNKKSPILLLDGGDVMTGNPIADMTYKDAYGGALLEMMNMIGYDAWAFGNHDLDISQNNLKALISIARFKTVNANLKDSAGKLFQGAQEYAIIERGGVRIGIIGIMSRHLFELTNTNNLKGLQVGPPLETLQMVVDRIDPETDLIVAINHQGVDEDSTMAERLNGVDVIIGAHSHTRLRSPKVVNGVIIVQTGANCENLGELELTVDDDRVTSSTGKLHTLWARPEYPRDSLTDFVNEWKDKVEKDYNRVIGMAESDMRRSRGGESGIGHFIADAIRDETGADFALTNSSGIRKDILKGDIRKVDLFEVAPFRNYLTTFTLKGSEVRELVGRYVKGIAEGKTSIDLSGIECSWKKEAGSTSVTSIILNGAELDDAREYRCGTIDYVINQAERYLHFVPSGVSTSEILLYDALVRKVTKEKSIKDNSEYRFKEIK